MKREIKRMGDKEGKSYKHRRGESGRNEKIRKKRMENRVRGRDKKDEK